VDSSCIVVTLKRFKLSREIRDIPEGNLIQVVPADRTYQTLNERVRERDERYRLDFVDVENPEIRFPAMEFEQEIIIRT